MHYMAAQAATQATAGQAPHQRGRLKVVGMALLRFGEEKVLVSIKFSSIKLGKTGSSHAADAQQGGQASVCTGSQMLLWAKVKCKPACVPQTLRAKQNCGPFAMSTYQPDVRHCTSAQGRGRGRGGICCRHKDLVRLMQTCRPRLLRPMVRHTTLSRRSPARPCAPGLRTAGSFSFCSRGHCPSTVQSRVSHQPCCE